MDNAPPSLLALLSGQVGYYALYSLGYSLQEDRENTKSDIHWSDGLWHNGWIRPNGKENASRHCPQNPAGSDLGVKVCHWFRNLVDQLPSGASPFWNLEGSDFDFKFVHPGTQLQ